MAKILAQIYCAFIILLGGFSAAPAQADDCRLARLGVVDISSSSDSAVLVPVSIEGTPKLMAIDTGAPLSAVDPQAANDLHLITNRIFQGYMYTVSGELFTRMAVIHAMNIGQMHAENVRVLVWPSRMWNDSKVAGTLAADVLRHYDIDIDVDNQKLSFFSQDHCPGKVVYWQATSVAVVPIHVVNSGHIIVPVVLDGHTVDAVLDTGAFGTILSLEAAHNMFGLEPGSPELAPTGGYGGANRVPIYRHTFSTLQLEGITIRNPTVYVWDDPMKYATTQAPHVGSRLNDMDEREGKTDLTLGITELRHLHVYIAYKEQKLYISAAGAAQGSGAQVPVTAPAVEENAPKPSK